MFRTGMKWCFNGDAIRIANANGTTAPNFTTHGVLATEIVETFSCY